MCESRTFVISLNLSNFFVDHRAMCKIFISKKMKCVTDLEDHISAIFNITDFYIISRGHYIPSTEDIRILQPDDMLFAVPNQWNNSNIVTSTPRNNVAVEKKSRKEENRDSNCNIDKPRKTKKRKSCDLDLEQQNNKDIVTNNILKPKKKRKKSKNVEEILSNIDANDFQENPLDTPVKEKVSYFEKQIKKPTNKIDNKKNISKDLNNATPVQDKLRDAAVVADSETQRISPNFKQRKLVFQKRNNDLISHDLPRSSNIIKSILISSKPSNWDQSMLPTANCKSKANLENVSEKLNCNVLQVNNIKNSFECNGNDGIEISGFSSIKERSFDNHVKSSNILESNSTPSANKIKNIQQNIDCMEQHSSLVYIENENSVNVENTAVAPAGNVTSIESNIANQPIQKFVNQTDTWDLIQLKSPISSTPSTTTLNLKSPDIEVSSSKGNMSPTSDFSVCDTTSNSSMLPEDTNHLINGEFITKRKRKRSRKKKSKVSSSEVVLVTAPNQKSEYIFRPPAAHVSHIKFNDNGDPINDVNQISKEDSLKSTSGFSEQSVDITDVPNPPSSVINTQEDKSNSSPNNDSAVIVDKETFEENSKLSYNANDFISEDTILRSPLMTSLKPKCGDIIAFQMLRLTNNYTPQISRYITGKVLAVTDDNTEIEMKIIDGIDECKEPEGKFSIENENDNVLNIRTLNWSALFAPRLIFP